MAHWIILIRTQNISVFFLVRKPESILLALVCLTGGREGGSQNTVGFQKYLNSLQVKFNGLLLPLNTDLICKGCFKEQKIDVIGSWVNLYY